MDSNVTNVENVENVKDDIIENDASIINEWECGQKIVGSRTQKYFLLIAVRIFSGPELK